MQEVSNRLSAVYQSAAQTVNKHLGCLDKAYKKVKQEAKGVINKVVGRFRKGDIEKADGEAGKALVGTQVDEKVENFKKKLQEIINAMRERQQQEDGAGKEAAESTPEYEMSEDSSLNYETSEAGAEKIQEEEVL